jgi:uncharacterized membrane protein
MIFEIDINIEQPINKVVEVFSDPEGMYHWMPNLDDIKLLEGQMNEVGAKSELTLRANQRMMKRIQTITVKNLPTLHCVEYDDKNVFNRVSSDITVVSENCTKLHVVHEFQFKGLMKIFTYFIPQKAFKVQALQYLHEFKKYAENTK